MRPDRWITRQLKWLFHPSSYVGRFGESAKSTGGACYHQITPSNRDRGLKVLVSPSATSRLDPPIIDVVLIHGLGGSPRKTWRHSGGSFWPLWIPEHPGMENTRVTLYGYDSNVSRRGTLHIGDFGDRFLEDLIDHWRRFGDVSLECDRKLTRVVQNCSSGT